ncbi:hypothetical protein [Streptomyces europaeiscabiei]|uniref:hypothetical protein n=1 Tax=Streptomyces europaeiscabiei TaxID=146819 RepID=UPI00399B9558
MALAVGVGVGVAGLWALPVLAVPLLPAPAVVPAVAAVLSPEVGREPVLGEPEPTVRDRAALTHGSGRLSLLDPVPAGPPPGSGRPHGAGSRCRAARSYGGPGWTPRSSRWWSGRRIRTVSSRAARRSHGL